MRVSSVITARDPSSAREASAGRLGRRGQGRHPRRWRPASAGASPRGRGTGQALRERVQLVSGRCGGRRRAGADAPRQGGAASSCACPCLHATTRRRSLQAGHRTSAAAPLPPHPCRRTSAMLSRTYDLMIPMLAQRLLSVLADADLVRPRLVLMGCRRAAARSRSTNSFAPLTVSAVAARASRSSHDMPVQSGCRLKYHAPRELFHDRDEVRWRHA